MNIHCGLEVGGGGENLALADGQGGVALDDPGAHAAHGFNAEGERRHVQQQQPLHRSGEDAALETSPHSHALVGVDALEGQAARDGLHQLLYRRNPAGAAHHQHLGDLADGHAGVVDGLIHGCPSGLHQVAGEVVELGPGDRDFHVEGAFFAHGDIGQGDGGLFHGRELDLGFLSGLPDALHGGAVAAQVHAVLALELLDKIVHQALVEVVSTQVVVARRGQNFDDTGGNLQNGHVEGAAAQVVDHDFLALFLVHAVGQGRGGGLVDNALDLQAGDFACVLGGLALGVGEVGRHGDNRFGDRGAQVALCVGLELLENHGRDLLGGEFFAVDGDAVVAAHLTLDGGDSALVVGDGLALGDGTHHALSGLGKGHHGGRGAAALGVGNYHRLAALHHGHAAVGGAQINSYDSSHCYAPFGIIRNWPPRPGRGGSPRHPW